MSVSTLRKISILLSDVRPDLRSEWAPENEVEFDSISTGSHKKVRWVCSNYGDHIWEASVPTRLRSGCPYCSNRRVLKGFNDLASQYPNLAAEWSPSNCVGPDAVTAGSDKKVEWVCSKHAQHVWTAYVYSRTKGSGCPYCANKKVLPGFNDLATTHPDLAEEWYPQNSKQPTEISHGHDKNVKWICSNDRTHIWSAKPVDRTNGNGCPFCSGLRAHPGTTDLSTVRPDIAVYWSEKNNLTAQDVTATSTKKMWWVCDKGHEFTSQVQYRTRRDTFTCPVCSNKKVLLGFNDLATTHPELAKEWSPDNTLSPTQVTFGSETRVKWVCINNPEHTWEAVVYSRSKGSGCPHCGLNTSKGESEIQNFILSLGIPMEEIIRSSRKIVPNAELDIYLPNHRIAIEFNGTYWHSDMFVSKEYHKQKTSICAERNIRLIHIWEDDWRLKQEIVKRLLKNKIGIKDETTVYARKTKVVSIDKHKATEFFNLNHLLGYTSGTYYIALETDDGIVAAMILTRRGDILTLDRYATSCNVPGGHSKLVSWVEKNIEYSTLVTFADLAVSNGDLYEKTGWTRDKVLKPDYMYVVGNKRVHKFNYRKDRFKKDPSLKYDPNMTETELAMLNNIPRIWDCGKIRYTKERPI